MAEIRTHEQVLGIIGVLAHEANDDGVEDRSEYSAETRAAWLWLEETDAALRLALETAERERGEIAVCADGWMKRTVAAERERDEARARLARIEEVTRDSGIGPAAAANNLARLSSPAPPADAAREALRYCEEVFQHNEINRVDGEEIADRALVLIRRALSTPAPAPSTDPWRACGCADPDNCEHIFRDPAPSAPAPAPDTIEHPCGCYAPDGDVCWKHAAPTAHALRRCEQP